MLQVQPSFLIAGRSSIYSIKYSCAEILSVSSYVVGDQLSKYILSEHA